MNRSTPVELISTPREQGADGVFRAGEETARTVFANVKSASAKEFHDGFRNGLNPQFVFRMFRYDYEGESVVDYEGCRYAVYRNYTIPGTDYVELYAERKGGTNREDFAGA
ncbi:MAG: hypothetical protein IKR84_01320 [Oscillibacter sp.]|nr:hypothetical protein [Oscillibacter sp.]